MAKLLRLTTVLACILLGAVVGMLNPQPVNLDLGFASLQTSLGLAVLVALPGKHVPHFKPGKELRERVAPVMPLPSDG